MFGRAVFRILRKMQFYRLVKALVSVVRTFNFQNLKCFFFECPQKYTVSYKIIKVFENSLLRL